MPRLTLPGLFFWLALSAGCIWDEPKTPTVANNPFGAVFRTDEASHLAKQAASIATAARVDTIGRKILVANPQIGLQPMFRTIGAPQPDAFHKGTTEVDVTEGLAQQCKTDGQLAAILCQELGKMVVEREALATPETRQPDPLPPLDVPVGHEGGSFGPPDQLHRAELAKFEAAHPRRVKPPPALPDPQALARAYLVKSGFPAADMEAAAGILRSAETNQTLARQITAVPTPQR
jgi:hypothetical protein